MPANGAASAADDGVALQAAHEAVFGVGSRAERGHDHAWHEPETTEHGHEAGRAATSERGRGADTRYETGRDRAGNLPEPGAGRHRSGRESGGSGRGRSRSHAPGREAAAEKSMEPAPKSVELDLGT